MPLEDYCSLPFTCTLTSGRWMGIYNIPLSDIKESMRRVGMDLVYLRPGRYQAVSTDTRQHAEELLEYDANLKREAAEAAKAQAEAQAHAAMAKAAKAHATELLLQRQEIQAVESAKEEVRRTEKAVQQAILRAADRVAREAADAAEAAEKERATKAANVQHKKAINRKIFDTLVTEGASQAFAKRLGFMLAHGEIPNTKINYE